MRLKFLLLSLLAVFAPIEAAIVTVMVLVSADLILGVMAAKKRGEPITSAGLRRTISKLCIFEVALLLGFLAQQYLTGDLIPVSKLVAAYIGLVEFTSITENLNEINGQSIFTNLLSKLGKEETDKLK